MPIQYSPACLSLLSTPLPPDFPAPALLVPFFLRCVDVATKRRCAESIRAIHTLVSSGYGYLAELLTPAQKLQLRERMAGFLSIQDNSVLLLSLATLACIGTVLDSTDPGGPGEASKSDDASRQKGGTKEFFTGKKAPKVLQLVTNIVIDIASRETCDLDVCVDEIRLATAIVSAVGDRAKDSLATNDTVNTAKLIEKIQRPGLGKKVLGEVSYGTIQEPVIFHKPDALPRSSTSLGRYIQRGRRFQGYPQLLKGYPISRYGTRRRAMALYFCLLLWPES